MWMLWLAALACGGGTDGGFGNAGDPVTLTFDTGPFPTGGTTAGTTGTGTTATTGTGTTGSTTTTGTGTTGSTTTGPDIQGTGHGRGDTAYDLVAPDQDGDAWSLYDHYGSVVVLLFGDGWDYNFQIACGYIDGLAASYGVSYAVFLMDDRYTKAPADQDAAAAWADAYGLDTVLWDPQDGSVSLLEWAPVSFRALIIDPEMVIAWDGTGAVPENQLESELLDVLF